MLAPLIAGELLGSDVLDDDLRFVQDLGLVVLTSAGVEIANPIYREVLPRPLGQLLVERQHQDRKLRILRC